MEPLRVLVVDDHPMFRYGLRTLLAALPGVRGYLLKSAGQAEITRAVRAVGQGEAIFGPAVARRMMSFFGSPPSGPEAAVLPELTGREREVLALISAGETNAAIARRLLIS